MAEESTEQKKSSSSGSRSTSSSSGGSSDRRGGRSSRYQSRSSSYHRRGRYHRRKVCMYCADKSKVIDWKNVDGWNRFIADNGAIFPRRKTGMCAKHQRSLAVAVKRARHMALVPYTTEHVRIMGRS